VSRGRRPGPLLWVLPIGFLVAVPFLLWHGLVGLPHEYDVLAQRGVPVRVAITSCGPGQGGDSHGYGCHLETDYSGVVHRWKVDRDVRAQAGPDGAANGLVDPEDPGTSALAEDVDRRLGAGPSGGPVLMAGFCGALGLAGCGLARRRRAGWTMRGRGA